MHGPDVHRNALRALQREADHIVGAILDGECPEVDLDIAIARLRDAVEREFPGSARLFEMIYASRFDRLREQFRRATTPFG